MINPKDFYSELKKNKITFFTGVPDSLLKDFCAFITSNSNDSNHVINTNEGSAVAMAIGKHMAKITWPALKERFGEAQGNLILVNPICNILLLCLFQQKGINSDSTLTF